MKYFLNVVSASLVIFMFGISGFVSFEQNIARASTSSSTNVVVTLNVTTGISVTANSASLTMSNPLSISQNTSVGSSTFTVITNDILGYTLGLNATTSPAMQGSGVAYNIPDLAATPATFSVGAGTSAFGFSAYGSDVTASKWGTDGSCGSSGTLLSNAMKYAGFTTSATTTASRTATTTPTGVTTTVCYGVAQGTSFFVPAGTYTATIVATATTLP